MGNESFPCLCHIEGWIGEGENREGTREEGGNVSHTTVCPVFSVPFFSPFFPKEGLPYNITEETDYLSVLIISNFKPQKA